MSVPVRRVDPACCEAHEIYTRRKPADATLQWLDSFPLAVFAVVLLDERLPTLVTRAAVTTFSAVDKLMNHKRLTRQAETSL